MHGPFLSASVQIGVFAQNASPPGKTRASRPLALALAIMSVLWLVGRIVSNLLDDRPWRTGAKIPLACLAFFVVAAVLYWND